jgi:hypothetical protein
MITITPDNGVESISSKGIEINSKVWGEQTTGQSATTPVKVNLIPESFWNGLRDCESGRVVDMGRAMEEPPRGQ